MANTSATGGFLKLQDMPPKASLTDGVSGGSRIERQGGAEGALLPEHTSPPQERLEDVLHDVFTGITGFPGELVRPRWQPDPPEVPEPDVNWCAFGITQFDPANFPEIRHDGEGEGCDELVDQEELQVLVSFFGPLHMVNARVLRRGLHVPQNRALLRPAGLAFVKAGTILPLPGQVALGWRPRADIPLTFRLETKSSYAALNLLKSDGSITSQPQSGGQGAIEVPTGCHACSRACWRE